MTFYKKLKNAPAFRAGDATILREIMHPKKDGIPIGYSVAHARVEVGKASLAHQLKSSETYFILEGEGKMYIDDEILDVSKDDIFWIPPKATQYIKNTGDSNLVFLCIVEPYWQEDEETIL